MTFLARCGLVLLLAACVDRSLEPVGVEGDFGNAPSVDLAGVDQRGVDLSLTSIFDMASGASPGVPCGNMTCSVGQICCVETNGLPQCRMTMCMASMGFRCDGPEDCTMGRRCTARLEFGGYVVSTRCRGMNDGNDPRVCHVDNDCGGSQVCAGIMTTPGGPPLAICIFPD